MMNGEMYCAGCNEEYARNFSFCPVCGAVLINSENKTGLPENVLSESSYQITLVREKNVKQRNLLFLSAIFLISALAVAGVIFSIFNKTLDIGAIETENLFAFVADLDPVAVDPAEEVKKDKKKQGGGGGGRNDADPVQKGKEATQVENPLFSPSKDYVRLTDPDLKIRAATQGTKRTPISDEPYGLKNGGLIPSDGQGCCGGQGKGRGTGQGNDPGNGLGPGKNGGFGGGSEGLYGGNREDDEKDIPKVKVGVTQTVRILSKPRANYTDLARQNVVQGKVILKVTFLASGSIGAISVVSGLSGGLTEQAIAAARAIRFESAKTNGAAVSVTKTIEYNFAIF